MENDQFSSWITPIVITTALMSLGGSSYVIVMYFIMRVKKHITNLHFALFLSLSDFFNCCAWLLGYADKSCVVMGAFRIYFSLSTSIWGFLISLYIVKVLWQFKYLKLMEKNLFIHFVAWISPMPILIVVLSANLSFFDEYWCWISISLLYDIPACIVITLNFIIYIASSYKYRQIRKESTLEGGINHQKEKDIVFHLRINAFIFCNFLSTFFIILYDITGLFVESSRPLSIVLLTALISPLQGIGNAIVFAADCGSEKFSSSESSSNSSGLKQ